MYLLSWASQFGLPVVNSYQFLTSMVAVVRNVSFKFMNGSIIFLRLWPSGMSCETPTYQRRWKQQIPPKCWNLHMNWHGITSQKSVTLKRSLSIHCSQNCQIIIVPKMWLALVHPAVPCVLRTFSVATQIVHVFYHVITGWQPCSVLCCLHLNKQCISFTYTKYVKSRCFP